MPRFRVEHLQSGEKWEVEISTSEEALEIVGWPAEVCRVYQLHEGPFADIEPPQIAKQISPPKPGRSHICPDCQVSMLEAKGQGELWWQCPSCDLLYQEWENQYYRADEL